VSVKRRPRAFEARYVDSSGRKRSAPFTARRAAEKFAREMREELGAAGKVTMIERRESWQVRYRDPSGRQRSEGGFATRIEAEERDAIVRAEIAKDEYRDPAEDRMTLGVVAAVGRDQEDEVARLDPRDARQSLEAAHRAEVRRRSSRQDPTGRHRGMARRAPRRGTCGCCSAGMRCGAWNGGRDGRSR
jgi:hypothetical protein